MKHSYKKTLVKAAQFWWDASEDTAATYMARIHAAQEAVRLTESALGWIYEKHPEIKAECERVENRNSESVY